MGFMSHNRSGEKVDRPRLVLERTRLEIALELLAAAGMMYAAFCLIINYSALPPSIPMHFNYKGEVDSWGSKESIWLLAGITAVIYISMMLVARIPHMFNYPFKITAENAERQYRIARTFIKLLSAEIVWLFAVLLCGTMEVALDKANTMSPVFIYFFLAVVLGSTIGFFVLSYRAR